MKKHYQEEIVNIDEVLSILNDIAIFGGLSDRQLETIIELLEKIHVPKGEFIFERGDEPSDIYIVQHGRVELLLDAEGSYLAKTVFTAGQCFGETAAIGIQPHTASAITLEDSSIIQLPTKAFLKIWETDKELFGLLAMNIAREACRRLNQSDEILLHYIAGSKKR